MLEGGLYCSVWFEVGVTMMTLMGVPYSLPDIPLLNLSTVKWIFVTSFPLYSHVSWSGVSKSQNYFLSLPLGKFGNRRWVFENPNLVIILSTFLNQRSGWFFILLYMDETRELTIGVPPFCHTTWGHVQCSSRMWCIDCRAVSVFLFGCHPFLVPCPSHLFSTLLTTFSVSFESKEKNSLCWTYS